VYSGGSSRPMVTSCSEKRVGGRGGKSRKMLLAGAPLVRASETFLASLQLHARGCLRHLAGEGIIKAVADLVILFPASNGAAKVIHANEQRADGVEKEVVPPGRVGKGDRPVACVEARPRERLRLCDD
jgi:hypothetical protein